MIKTSIEREEYFLTKNEELLSGGAAFSEWCTFVSKSVYNAFISSADLSAIITSLACIETFFRTEDKFSKGKKLFQLINEYSFLDDKTKKDLHRLRKFRNHWIHLDEIDDSDIIHNEVKYEIECKKMAFLSIELLLKVLFSQPFV